jgi:hypothetical protein
LDFFMSRLIITLITVLLLLLPVGTASSDVGEWIIGVDVNVQPAPIFSDAVGNENLRSDTSRGGWVFAGAAGFKLVDFPSVEKGLSRCVQRTVTTGFTAITIDASDYVILEGAKGVLGKGLQNSTTLIGDHVCFYGLSDTEWVATNLVGTTWVVIP